MSFQQAILGAVTNGELKVGENFALVFMILMGLATVLVGSGLFAPATWKERLKTIVIFIGGGAMTVFAYFLYDQERSIRKEGIYVEGLIIDYCRPSRSAGGSGVEFEYFIDGVRYTNCNHNEDQAHEIGQKFYVRVSVDYPTTGRIDFERPIENVQESQ